MMYELKEMDKKKEGIEEGIKIGREEGIGIGEAKATDRMARLTTLLALDGKIEDIIRVSSDETYRNAKMKEYGI